MKTANACVPVTVTPTPFVNLQLSKEQAETLYDLTYRIGGMPEGRRGHFDAIRVALSPITTRVQPVFAPDAASIHYRD